MAGNGSKYVNADGTEYMDQLEMLKRSVVGLDSCPKQSDHTVEIIELDKHLSVTQCMQCNQIYGVDDSIGLDELLDMLGQGQFRCRTPCKECGNDDPNKILVKLEGRGEVMVYTLTCTKCDALYLEFEVQGHADAGKDTPPNDGKTNESKVGDEVELRMECPKCENTEEELFQKTMRGDRIYKIRCLACGHGNTFHENMQACENTERKGWWIVTQLARVKTAAEAVTWSSWEYIKSFASMFTGSATKQTEDNVSNKRPVTAGLKPHVASFARHAARRVILNVGVEFCKNLIPGGTLAYNVARLLTDVVAHKAGVLLEHKLNPNTTKDEGDE